MQFVVISHKNNIRFFDTKVIILYIGLHKTNNMLFKCCKSDATIQTGPRATAPVAEPVKQDEVETTTVASDNKEEEVAEEEVAKMGYNCCGL